MTDRSTRASSDSESDASRTQRQAIGGAPQARSGVERVNQRGKKEVRVWLFVPVMKRPAVSETQPSTSQQLVTTNAKPVSSGQLAGVNIG